MKKITLTIGLFFLVSCGGDEKEIHHHYHVEQGKTFTCLENTSAYVRDPRQTTYVTPILNLNPDHNVIPETGIQFTTEGNAIGVTQVGLQTATSTTLTSHNFTLPLSNDFSASAMTWDITLSASSENNGTVSMNLNTAAGLPPAITTFNDLRTLAAVINAQIFSPALPQTAIDIMATAVDHGGGNYALQITATAEGENSQISLSNLSANTTQIGFDGTQTSTGGIPKVGNGYPQQSIDITSPEMDTVTYTALTQASVRSTASELNALKGISASAITSLTLTDYNNTGGNMLVNINGVDLVGDSLATIEAEINLLTGSTLPGISAELNATTGVELYLTSAYGDDVRLSITSIDDGDSLSVQGDLDAPPQTLEVDSAGDGVTAGAHDASLNSIVVGGSMTITLNEGYSIANATPPSIGLFQPFSASVFTEVTFNRFDPAIRSTYNSAASVTIYDSLGGSHILTHYFVKQDYRPTDPTTAPNHWIMYVLIDGQDVGDADTSLPPPENTAPSRQSYHVHFNQDGSINNALTDSMLVSNWTPTDENGEANGALGPQPALAGGTSTLADPPTSSNFVIISEGFTQFYGGFYITEMQQNGHAAGFCQIDSQ